MGVKSDESDVAVIAAELSSAQRSFLAFLPADMTWRETSVEIARQPRNALRGFGQFGLIEGYYKEEVRHRLTPLGLAVREHLERENG